MFACSLYTCPDLFSAEFTGGMAMRCVCWGGGSFLLMCHRFVPKTHTHTPLCSRIFLRSTRLDTPQMFPCGNPTATMKSRPRSRLLWLRKEEDGYLKQPRHFPLSPRCLSRGGNKHHLFDADVSLARESEKRVKRIPESRELVGYYNRIVRIDWIL